MSAWSWRRCPGEPQLGGPGRPAYQDGGDNQGGVEETVGDVGGVEAAVHAEAICHVPLADLRRPRREGWEGIMGKKLRAGLQRSWTPPG